MSSVAIPLPPTGRHTAPVDTVPCPHYRPRTFTAIVRNWLLLVEHGYCGACHGAIPLQLMSKTGRDPRYHSPRCKACVAAKTHRRYVENPEITRRWQREHPEKMREYMKRYTERNRETINQRAVERYAAGNGGRVRRWRSKALPEVFESRCLICNREFTHDGTRLTCSIACLRKKLKREF